MLHNTVFYVLFISQIVFISWYVPNRITGRMLKVIEKFPPNQYPKLYTKPIENHHKKRKNYALSNRVLFYIGVLLLGTIIYWENTNQKTISPMVPWAYFMLQMIPLMWLEVSEQKYFKAMREANKNTIKRAEIRPRNLFDFVSKKIILTAIVVQMVAISLVLIRYGMSEKAWINIGIMFMANIFFIAVIYKNIYGNKQDPYQSNKDRLRIIEVTVKSLVFVSIGVSLFLSVHMLIKMFDWNFLSASVMSIYCQGLVWISLLGRIKAIKLEDLNFNVYKKTATNP